MQPAGEAASSGSRNDDWRRHFSSSAMRAKSVSFSLSIAFCCRAAMSTTCGTYSCYPTSPLLHIPMLPNVFPTTHTHATKRLPCCTYPCYPTSSLLHILMLPNVSPVAHTHVTQRLLCYTYSWYQTSPLLHIPMLPNVSPPHTHVTQRLPCCTYPCYPTTHRLALQLLKPPLRLQRVQLLLRRRRALQRRS